jgi:hypothetical protein
VIENSRFPVSIYNPDESGEDEALKHRMLINLYDDKDKK